MIAQTKHGHIEGFGIGVYYPAEELLFTVYPASQRIFIIPFISLIKKQ